MVTGPIEGYESATSGAGSHRLTDLRIIIPITKVDEEKRLVFGTVTEEIVDQSDEIFDYEGSKAFWVDWSERIAKATGGKSVGNMRLMHQPIVAGKLTQLDFDDANKRISCCGKVVDDESWRLVLEGCLSGFSMGGKYVRRWKDPDNKKITRFTAKPVEVSIVDNPCLQSATFEYIKADGTTELRKFHHAGDGDKGDEIMGPTAEQIAAKADALAKAAGTPDAADQFLDEARITLDAEAEIAAKAGEAGGDAEGAIEKPADDAAAAIEGAEPKIDDPAAELEPVPDADPAKAAADLEASRVEAAKTLVQVWQAPDGSTHAKKSIAVDHVLGLPAPPAESAVDKALRLARGEADDAAALDGPAAALDDLAADLDSTHKGLVAAEQHLAPLTKGLYEVKSLASLIQEMSWLVSCTRDEAAREGDGSAVPAQLFAAIRQLGTTLIAMAQEEVAELITMLGAGSDWADAAVPIDGEIVAIVELAALADAARANGDAMAKAGARNSKGDAAKIQSMHDNAVALGATCDAGKAAGGVDSDSDVIKALRSENVELKSEVTKAIDGIADLGAQLATMREQVEKIGRTPEPLPPRSDHVVVERNGRSEKITDDALANMSDAEKADLAIRLSQQRPLNKLPS